MSPLPVPEIRLPEQWDADWISASDAVADPYAAPLLRREFPLRDDLQRATLHISGLGSHLCWINGMPASDALLAPGFTDYRCAAKASSIDVTEQLRGRPVGVVSVELGRGFFDMHTPEEWGWTTAPWRDRPRLTAELHLEYADGTQEVLATDDSWRCATGGLRFDSLYEGESWDETQVPQGWTGPGFDDSEWPAVHVEPRRPQAGTTHHRAAREVATRGLPLRESLAEPIRVIAHHEPTWTRLPDGRHVGDIGRVIAGWVRLEPQLGGRQELRITHGERLAEDGSVIAENRFITTGRFQRDEVILDGEPWEAHHSYKGFRYLEVEAVGADGGATDAGIGTDVRVIGCEAHADVPVTGTTSCSVPTLDWLDGAFTRTVATNLHWQLTDTPTYEKNGWTGDAQVALPAILTRFDVSRFFTSWLDDMLDAEREDGSLPVIVPSADWGFGDGQCAPAPEWTTLYPVLVDALVREYGLDLWPVHAEAVDRYLLRELERLDADGLAVGILGDYLSPGTGGPPPEDIRLASSLSLRRALDVVAASGHSAHVERFHAARAALADAVNHVFFGEATGCYGSRARRGSLAGDPRHGTDEFRQAPQVLALDAGIVADGQELRVLEALVGDIRARGGHHHVGTMGMARLCSVLVRGGYGELALEVATNPQPPSWEVWRRAGHSTLLEMWADPVRSRAHYFQGAGLRFVEDDLVGLERTADGWARFRVAPQIVPGIDHVSARRATDDGGVIRAGWRRQGDEVLVEVTVPNGAHAEVLLPDGRTIDAGPGEHRQILGPSERGWR